MELSPIVYSTDRISSISSDNTGFTEKKFTAEQAEDAERKIL